MERPSGEGLGFGDGFSSSFESSGNDPAVSGVGADVEGCSWIRIDILLVAVSWLLTGLALVSDMAFGATVGAMVEAMEVECFLGLEALSRLFSIASATLSAFVSIASLYRFYRWSASHRALRNRLGDLSALERDDDLLLLERLLKKRKEKRRNEE